MIVYIFYVWGKKKKRKVKVHIYQSLFQGDTSGTILLCPSTVNHKIFIECDEVRIPILSFSFV